MAVNWFDLDGSAEATGWFSDESDVTKQPQPEQGSPETEILAVAGMVENQQVLPESTDVKNFAQNMSNLSTKDAE